MFALMLAKIAKFRVIKSKQKLEEGNSLGLSSKLAYQWTTEPSSFCKQFRNGELEALKQTL